MHVTALWVHKGSLVLLFQEKSKFKNNFFFDREKNQNKNHVNKES